MRAKTERKVISVVLPVFERLVSDRAHYKKVIGGGRWSFSDTIKEYQKILGDKGAKG